MAGFDDLVAEAMPYLALEQISGSAGSSWEWTYLLYDSADTLVDLTGVTGVCEIRDRIGGTLILAPTVTFPAAGQVKCAATPTQTAALAAGRYVHEVELTNASSRKVKLVGAGDSLFIVKGEVTA